MERFRARLASPNGGAQADYPQWNAAARWQYAGMGWQAFRASGTNSNELYILSGIGIALFIGVRLLMFKLK